MAKAFDETRLWRAHERWRIAKRDLVEAERIHFHARSPHSAGQVERFEKRAAECAATLANLVGTWLRQRRCPTCDNPRGCEATR